MKLIYWLGGLLGLLGSIAADVRAQAPAWQSVGAVATGTGNLRVRSTATDAGGNVYLTGFFNGTVQLGSTSLTSAGSDDVFVAKYSPAGRSFTWAVRAGGTGQDQASGVAVSGSSVYVAGVFLSGSATFGATTLTKTSGAINGFLAKLTDAGSSAAFTWVQQVGGTGADFATGVAAVGNTVYLGGQFSSPSVQLGATTLSSAGTYDVYVARLTDAGSSSRYDWAVRAGGPSQDYFYDLFPVGNTVYLTGTFLNSASVGSTTLTGGPGVDTGFVAKLTDAGGSGSFNWALGSSSPNGGIVLRGIAAVGSSVYVAGEFDGVTATFGPTTLTNASNQNLRDIVVAKLTDAGSTAAWTWAQRAGSVTDEYCGRLLVRGRSIYLSGYFTGLTTTFGTTTLTNAATNYSLDIFVTRVADAGSTGSFVWAQQAGGTGYDTSENLSSTGTDLQVWGSAAVPATFGSFTLSGTAVPSPPFVATLSDAAGLAAATPVALAGVTLFPNPAPGAATVRVPAGAGAATVQVLDALGRMVRHETVAAGQDYRLANLTPGLYAVRVQLGEATATQRLVVE